MNEWSEPATKETKPKIKSQREEIRDMCAARIIRYRIDMGGATSQTLEQVRAVVFGFQGAPASIYENHLNILPRRQRLVHIDEDVLMIPERASVDFAESVRKRFPSAVVVLGRYVTFD